MKGVTAYQLEILQHVVGAPAAEPLDFDQLLEKLSWTPSKESAQFPIRSLITKKLLEKGPLQLRRGRQRVVYLATKEGRAVLDPREASATAEPPVPVIPVKVVGKLSAESANSFLPGPPDDDLDLPPELVFE